MTNLERVHGAALGIFLVSLGGMILGGWGAVVALLAVSVATATQPDRHPLEAPPEAPPEPPPAPAVEPPRNRRRLDVRA